MARESWIWIFSPGPAREAEGVGLGGGGNVTSSNGTKPVGEMEAMAERETRCEV